MAHSIRQFDPATTEAVSRILGDLFTGTELTRLFAEVGISDYDPGEGLTKWRRIDLALNNRQVRAGNGTPVVRFLTLAMRPQRTVTRKAAADAARDSMNQILSLAGFEILVDGRVARTKATTTDTEALERSVRLRSRLELRGVHPEVLKCCRPDLLVGDYYEAVFEAVKGLGERLRVLTGVDLDGHRLVQTTLGGDQPMLRLNTLAKETERNEQRGIARLAEGLFSAFRNPAAHETRQTWHVEEQDALDVLGTLSLIHRRVDAAQVG